MPMWLIPPSPPNTVCHMAPSSVCSKLGSTEICLSSLEILVGRAEEFRRRGEWPGQGRSRGEAHHHTWFTHMDKDKWSSSPPVLTQGVFFLFRMKENKLDMTLKKKRDLMCSKMSHSVCGTTASEMGQSGTFLLFFTMIEKKTCHGGKSLYAENWERLFLRFLELIILGNK